jgi:two-component system chemotaxis response regulator CheY
VTTLDITMPEKDGLAALKEIIAIDPAARVVMCSVVKPFQADRVNEAVGKALA